jgi:hypothetical protein
MVTGCAQPVGTVGYVGGERISEAEVDRAAAAFAPYGFARDNVTLFVVEARVARHVMATKGLAADTDARLRAASIPEVKRILDDVATREVMLGVIDFLALETQLTASPSPRRLGRADPRYGRWVPSSIRRRAEAQLRAHRADRTGPGVGDHVAEVNDGLPPRQVIALRQGCPWDRGRPISPWRPTWSRDRRDAGGDQVGRRRPSPRWATCCCSGLPRRDRRRARRSTSTRSPTASPSSYGGIRTCSATASADR